MSSKSSQRQSLTNAKSFDPATLITQVQKPNSLNASVRSLLGLDGCWKSVMKCIRKPKKIKRVSLVPEVTLPALLPPQPSHLKGRKTLVLDLDETLVHSTFQLTDDADLDIPVDIQQTTYNIRVFKRTGLKEFLQKVSEIYEVVLWTASLPEYAQTLVDKIDPDNCISASLYRESCTIYNRKYVKDLARLGRQMKDVILIDNSDTCFMFQPENAFHIENFFDNRNDLELYKLIPFLEHLAQLDDVRNIPLHWKNFDKSYFKEIQATKTPQKVTPNTSPTKTSLLRKAYFHQRSHSHILPGKKMRVGEAEALKVLANLTKRRKDMELERQKLEKGSFANIDDKSMSESTNDRDSRSVKSAILLDYDYLHKDSDLENDEKSMYNRGFLPGKIEVNSKVTQAFAADSRNAMLNQETESSEDGDVDGEQIISQDDSKALQEIRLLEGKLNVNSPVSQDAFKKFFVRESV